MTDVAIPPQRMNVTRTFDQALEHTKRVLFRPFDSAKWVCFGVIIFLDVLFGGGGGGSGAPYHPSSNQVDHGISQVSSWLSAHFAMILMITLVAIPFLIAMAWVLAWLSARGQMMLIRAVALNDARIDENWRATRASAWSLMWFKFALGVASMLTALAVGFSVALVLINSATASAGALILHMLPIGLFGVTVMLLIWLTSIVLRAFVSPLMYQFDLPVLAAWGRFWEIVPGNFWHMILLLLIRLAYRIAFGIAALLVGCITCCIGFIPVIHHTIFAPFYVFDRAYTLTAIGSLGPEYQIIRPETPVVSEDMMK